MASARKQFVVDEGGRKTAVILPIKEYGELLDDLEDLAIIAERKNDSTETLKAVVQRLEEK